MVPDHDPQARHPSTAPVSRERTQQTTLVRELQPVGFVDGALEAARAQITGDVNQGQFHGGNRNCIPVVSVVGRNYGPAVDDQASVTAAAGGGHRDVDRVAIPADQAPERRRRTVAQEAFPADRQYRRHPVASVGQARMPDGVDAAVDSVHPTGALAALHPVTGEAKLVELRDADRAVLARREVLQLSIDEFSAYVAGKSSVGWDSPP